MRNEKMLQFFVYMIFLFSFAEKLDRTMRLHIQNINKIKEADIALNGLTVIVGLEIETHGKGL